MRIAFVCAFVIACGDSGGGMTTSDAPPVDAAPIPDAPSPDTALVDAGTNLPPISPYPSCPTCQHAQYVVSQVTIPQNNTMAVQLGCDINADGEVDNQLGKILAALRAASQSVDAQAVMDAAFQDGAIFMLYDVEYTPSIAMTQVAGMRAFLGQHDPSDGLTAPAFYMGQGRFTVSYENGNGMGGSIQGGAGAFGPNDGVLQLTLIASDPPMNLPLERAYVAGTFSSTIQAGKLCGAIDAQNVRLLLIPQFADVLSHSVKLGGSTADTIKSLFDADHSCDTDPACTPSAPETCHCISASELESNSIIKSLLSPDLDLDPNEHNPFVLDPQDPTYSNDALSVGVGFVANHASFARP